MKLKKLFVAALMITSMRVVIANDAKCGSCPDQEENKPKPEKIVEKAKKCLKKALKCDECDGKKEEAQKPAAQTAEAEDCNNEDAE